MTIFAYTFSSKQDSKKECLSKMNSWYFIFFFKVKHGLLCKNKKKHKIYFKYIKGQKMQKDLIFEY